VGIENPEKSLGGSQGKRNLRKAPDQEWLLGAGDPGAGQIEMCVEEIARQLPINEK